MSIKGFQGTSLLDYPGKIASLVFFSGCNLSCGFCHNPGLVQSPEQYPDLPLADLLAMLEQRRGFIDGVVISGGEPTLDPQLPTLVAAIKQMGLAVKLDSNGLRPDVLQQLLDQRLLDYVGLDVKTSVERYGELHHHSVSIQALLDSIELLMQSAIEVEFRTTCVPGLVEQRDIEEIGLRLQGAKLWVLQQFVAEHAMASEMQQVKAHAPEVIRRFAATARNYVADVEVRGL